MTCFHRGEGISNDAPRCRRKVGVLQGDLKFRLDVILATFDFVDDRFVILAGNPTSATVTSVLPNASADGRSALS